MNVLGIGALFSRGKGVASLRQALQEGWREPSRIEIKGRTIPAYLADLEKDGDRALLRKLRRSDKLSKMSVLAASDAITDSGLSDEERKKMGVILATAYGAHATTFEFLDGVLDFGEAAVSPTTFSNSVHNAAASYISSAFGIQGPTLTVTQFFFSFQSALQLAHAWLRERRVQHVLAGGVDQFGEVLGYITAMKLNLARDGRIAPFSGTPPAAVPGEGAAFVVLGKEGAERAYCRVEEVRINDTGSGPQDGGLAIADADGLLPDEARYASMRDGGACVVSYAPLWGSMMTGSAFSVAAGAIILKDQVRFDSPVPHGPGGDAIMTEPGDSSIEFIRCIRYNCSGAKAEVRLRRAQKGTSPG